MRTERTARFEEAVRQLGGGTVEARMGAARTLVILADEWLADTVVTEHERHHQVQTIIDALCESIRSPFSLAYRAELWADEPTGDLQEQSRFYAERAELVAEAKVEHYFEEDKPTYKQGEEVDLMIWQKTELGFKVIIDNKYPGLVYGDQVFQYVHTGDHLKGYIATVRPDGKIDCTLQPTGQQYAKDFAEVLLQYLKDNGGVCNLGDKSEAEDIKRLFHVSKKVYKKAVGDLYKRRLITVEPLAIRLV